MFFLEITLQNSSMNSPLLAKQVAYVQPPARPNGKMRVIQVKEGDEMPAMRALCVEGFAKLEAKPSAGPATTQSD